jgi:hypothetical protein
MNGWTLNQVQGDGGVVQVDAVLANPIISNTRNNISYKSGAHVHPVKKGTADAEALVLLPADGVR